MADYNIGYDYYKQACKYYGMEPLNFSFYLLSLSREQLDAYNERAQQKKGA